MNSVVAGIAHQIPDRAPLSLAVGEQVQLGEQNSEWPEFVSVTTSHGSGWVPARYLSAPSGPAVARAEYDTTELSTEAGEVLEVRAEDRQSGWLWCRSHSGREGWVPVKTLKTFD